MRHTIVRDTMTEPDLPARLRLRVFMIRLGADDRGVAAVEFGLLLPVLATILLATADLAGVAVRRLQVQSLAQDAAGALAGLRSIPAAPAGRNMHNTMATMSVPGIAASASSIGSELPRIQGAGLPQIAIAALVPLPADTHASTTLFWGCGTKARLIAVRSPLCPDGSRAAAYAEVIMRAPVNRLVSWPDQILGRAVEARAVVRLG